MMNLFDGNMQFYSIKFLIFLSVTFSLFYITKKNYRLFGLLLLSYIFYSIFNIKHLPILIFVTCLNFFGAIYINNQKNEKRKRLLFLLVLTINISTLFLFKYLSFTIENINFIIGIFNSGLIIPNHSFELPLGLSFYIIATLGYVIDVYRKNSLPEYNYLKFGVFSSFFPIVQSGPIERSNNFLKQLNNEESFDYEKARSGLYIILSGLIKKYLIADRLSIIVSPIFEDINSYNSLFIIIAVITFAFQIYYDFSGYSDIAVGIGRLFGYDIKMNFNYPYTAKSISEFWKRWHISLSEWVRDYIFLPVAYYTTRKFHNLKIMKLENFSYFSAVFITMFITGIWHGASWNYIIWGLIFAFSMALSLMTKKSRKKILKSLNLNKYKRLLNFIRISNTFIIVCFAWIFFKTNNISDAIDLIRKIFNVDIFNFHILIDNYYSLIGKVPFITIIIGYLFLILYESGELFERRTHISLKFNEMNILFRWTIYILVVSIIFFFAVTGDSKFIYFKY